MTTHEAQRRAPHAVQQREAAGPVTSRAGMTVLPAASFGQVGPRPMSSAPAVTMQMPR